MPSIPSLRLQDLRPPAGQFDTIIDVRSPAEYREDHLPGAVSMPVLDDEERARVGTIYKQVSPFDARRLGAALVAANAARHLRGPLAGKGGGWRPLIYCWRGGQRSGAFASILAQVGWRVTLVEGGYKHWRSLVVDRVQRRPLDAELIVLDGNTGSAKTAILARLASRGHQVVDLEALANHRGSLFGSVGPQPSQKMFEGRLALALEALDPSRPVLVEAESSRIGAVTVPAALWKALIAAPRLRLEVPLGERAAFSVRDYASVTRDAPLLDGILDSLVRLHPRERVEAWREQARAGQWQALAEGLMRDHYDPRYARHRSRHADRDCGVVAIDRLDDLDSAASQVEAALSRIADQRGMSLATRKPDAMAATNTAKAAPE